MNRPLATVLALGLVGSLVWGLRDVAGGGAKLSSAAPAAGDGLARVEDSVALSRHQASSSAPTASAPMPLEAEASPDAELARETREGGMGPNVLQLSEDERALLEMYDEVALILEQDAADCDGMAMGVRTAIEAHAGEVRRVVEAAQARGAQEARDADERVKAAAGGQLERFRALVATALKTCASQLMPELQRLSSIQGKDDT